MINMTNMIVLTSTAGIMGTGMGGVFANMFFKTTDKLLSLVLSFAAGIMLAVVCFDLIPDALMLIDVLRLMINIILGIMMVYLLTLSADKLTDKVVGNREKNDKRKTMLVSGLVICVAIAIHNLPEGMAIGANSEFNLKNSMELAFLIAIHNIPEGMAICLPLVLGGMNKFKAVLLTALSGAPTLIGGFLGSFMGDMGNMAVAMCLSFAAGAMLYVIYCEMIPEIISLYKGRSTAFCMIGGLLAGLIICVI